MFPPELQVKQYIATVTGAYGFNWRVYRTASAGHLLFECVENPNFRVAQLIAGLAPDVRQLAEHVPGLADRQVLVRVLCCPACRAEQECTWIEPEDPAGDTPEPALQLCGSCGNQWTAEWPGYALRREA